MKSENRFYLGVALILISASGFGLMPLLAKVAYAGGATVTTTLFVRFALAAVVFLLYLSMKKREPVTISKRQWVALFLMGGVIYMLISTLYFSSINYIPTSLAALLLYTYPIFVALLSTWIDKEHFSGRIAVATVVTVGGLGLALGPSFQSINPIGVLLAVGAAVGYSIHIIISNRVVAKLPPLITSAVTITFTALSLLVTGLLRDDIHLTLEPKAWLAISALALFSTIIALFFFYAGIKLIGSTRASILSTFEPLVTIGLSILLFAEPFTWLQMVGSLLALLGVGIVVTGKEKPVAHEQENVATSS
ncbi:MAG TPA: DMT family transporter [Bacilli bacterium]|nr:DMT family transporter [Bacilli bacterium]